MEISVVIASYRYGHLAAHAIESVLEQTYPAHTIWFVDDGAGDCTHLAQHYPEVKFVLRDQNLGIVKNFQDMLSKVTTERVMFLGADNWLRPDTLEMLSQKTEDVVTYNIMVVGDRKREILSRHGGEARGWVQGGIYWDRSGGHHGSMLYNTELAKKVGGYESPAGRTVEDLVLYNKMLGAGGTRSHVPEAFLYYRRHRDNFNPC